MVATGEIASLHGMSLFDFFFPEQAQASHLRTLAAQGSRDSLNLRREQVSAQRTEQRNRILIGEAEAQIEKLENELAQSCLVIEGLIELLEENQILSRDALQERVQVLDAQDGVVDGKLTPAHETPKKPFEPKRGWPGEA